MKLYTFFKQHTLLTALISLSIGILLTSLIQHVHADTSTIVGCVDSNGTLRIVTSAADCITGETPLSWNSQTNNMNDYNTKNLTDTSFANAYLQYRDFSGFNFTGTNLSHADMSHDTLTNANFTNADLSQVNFMSDDLTTATFSGATFIDNNFTNANLSGLNFSDKDLGQVIFTGANLSHGNFENVHFGLANKNVNFSYADLTSVSIDDSSSITGSDFSHAILSHAFVLNNGNSDAGNLNFSDADLTNGNFILGDLTGDNFTNANLTGSHIQGSNFSSATWSNTTCPDGTNSDTDSNTCENNLTLP